MMYKSIRGKLYELLTVVILLGLFVGIIGSIVCSLIKNWIKSFPGILVIPGLVIIIIYLLYRVLYGGTDIEKSIELVLMYRLTQGKLRIEPRTSYNITVKACEDFDMAFSDDEKRELAKDWENAQRRGEPFHEFIADYYRQQIHYLFLLRVKKFGRQVSRLYYNRRGASQMEGARLTVLCQPSFSGLHACTLIRL
ncbi:hypothetical protein H8E77_20700 [bacterium]|nr:hypothetical protein [bacterium]